MLPAEPLHPPYEELQVGLDRTEIDLFRIGSSIEKVVVVWHAIDRARGWLMRG
jgi:hypothetical protein